MPYKDPKSPAAREAARLKSQRYRGRHRAQVNERERQRQARHRELNREAVNARATAYYWANREHLLEQKRRDHAKHRAERNAKKNTQYAADPTRFLESYYRWREKYPERYKANSRRHYAANKDRYKAHADARRARKLQSTTGDPDDITRFYKHVREANRLKCYWCGKLIPKGQRSVDHVRPLIKQGPHHPWNLVAAHLRCNSRKKAKLPEDFNGQFELVFTPPASAAAARR